MKKKILDTIEEKNLSIKDLDLSEIIPNSIDGVILVIINNDLQIHMPDNMSKEKYQDWMKGRGGIFLKDIKNKEQNSNYVLLNGVGEKIIARLINDDEIEKFNDLKLIDGKIKDKPYMKLKILQENEKLTKSDRYIEKSDKVVQEPKIIIPNQLSSNEDKNNQENISLFKD